MPVAEASVIWSPWLPLAMSELWGGLCVGYVLPHQQTALGGPVRAPLPARLTPVNCNPGWAPSWGQGKLYPLHTRQGRPDWTR